ncbi:SH3 domain-containing protein [uncultured Desulfosarcina sp.]|uniref:SH3 domain-containing protein n=1 Tax=uncultured Desulfosarcina sp. TaxID=218289 RepID=UPI0029C754F6|nr:SH3 domain-containing protein [uncultured Desulfosarcina sp.]
MKKSIPIILAFLLIFAGTDLAIAERLSVKADIANIRSGPDTSDVVIWQVEKYHPLEVVQKQGSWYLFEDFEGDRGWIHNSLLANVSTVIVKNDNCNVRSGPGTTNDIQFTVDKGVPFKVLEEKGDWLHVVHADGDQGWIHRSLVW